MSSLPSETLRASELPVLNGLPTLSSLDANAGMRICGFKVSGRGDLSASQILKYRMLQITDAECEKLMAPVQNTLTPAQSENAIRDILE